MRIAPWITLPLLGALVLQPAPAAAQGVRISFGARLGPEVRVYAYSPDRLGDWRANYVRWTPVTLYDINGHYYRRAVRGARPVLVYKYHNQYFLPPDDQGWRGRDHRYNYRRAPNQTDYGRARPYEEITVDPRLGAEVGVFGYSTERAGDWRRNYRRWTPVIVYEFNGRYYMHEAPGARPVALYRFGEEYFLPPDDPSWIGVDRRFDYNHRPNDEDRRRVPPAP